MKFQHFTLTNFRTYILNTIFFLQLKNGLTSLNVAVIAEPKIKIRDR